MNIPFILNDQNGSNQYELNKESIQIGRSAEMDITLNDPKASGTHCKIFIKDEKINFKDLNSTNGTYLNGTKVSSGIFYIGDSLTFGNAELKINIEKLNKELKEKYKRPLIAVSDDQVNFEIEDVEIIKDISQKKKRSSGLVDNKNKSRKLIKDEESNQVIIEELEKKKRTINIIFFVFLFCSPYIYLYFTNFNKFARFRKSWNFLDPEFEIYSALSCLLPIIIMFILSRTSKGSLGNRITKLYEYDD